MGAAEGSSVPEDLSPLKREHPLCLFFFRNGEGQKAGKQALDDEKEGEKATPFPLAVAWLPVDQMDGHPAPFPFPDPKEEPLRGL
jgi:hypothetical protein